MDGTTLQTLGQTMGMLILALLCLASLGVALSNRGKQQTQAPAGPQQAPVRVKRMSINLNMGIAHTHKIATQIVGIQLSGANVLAIAVSAASVVAGTVMLAIQRFPSAFLLWMAAGIIGIGLAFLIEGMTLGALIRIRLANKAIRSIEDRIERERDELISTVQRPAPTPDLKVYKDTLKSYSLAIREIEKDYRRRIRAATRLHRRNRNSSIPLAVVGSFSSACAGGLFYHAILSGFTTLENMALSALFALAVTGTFVSSELFKDIQEQAIKEGFEGDLAEKAIEKETRRLLSEVVHTEVVTYVGSQQARDDLKEDTRAMLKDVIGDIRQALRKPDTTRPPASDNATPGTITGIQEIHGTTPALSEATPQHATTANQGGDSTTRQASVGTSNATSTNATDDTTSPVSEGSHAALFHHATQQVPPAGQAATNGTDDKLMWAVEYLEAHPEYLTDTTIDLDALLASHLGLLRPTSARFWKHKALEVLHCRQAALQSDLSADGDVARQPANESATPGTRPSESDTRARQPASRNATFEGDKATRRHDTVKATAETRQTATSTLSPDTTDDKGDSQDTHTRVVAYATQHPKATQQEIAAALSLSVRTVQRHLKPKDTEARQPDLKVVR